jgi:hypothetical protein
VHIVPVSLTALVLPPTKVPQATLAVKVPVALRAINTEIVIIRSKQTPLDEVVEIEQLVFGQVVV